MKLTKTYLKPLKRSKTEIYSEKLRKSKGVREKHGLL